VKNLTIRRVDTCIEKINEAAQWFSEKWGVPVDAYKESMADSLDIDQVIPKWYVVLNDNEEIVAGSGVIENDFHDRPDLAPNLCAVYVEPAYRNKKIAKDLLAFVCKDMKKLGIESLYLVTDHKGLYENYGWSFLTMVQDQEGATRMYTIDL
jgi:N-acetylglutamate synthase-like GNAT family acetyltransferase